MSTPLSSPPPWSRRSGSAPSMWPARCAALVLAACAASAGCSGDPPRREPAAAHVAQRDSASAPRFNDVFIKATHNSYWTQYTGNTSLFTDIGAAGTWMRLWDQVAHEHVRSIELDLHRDVDDPYLDLRPHPGEFRVYHTNEPDNSTCFTLADCLQILQRLDYALPNHEVVHIALELKQVDRFFFDDGVFDDPSYSPAELDRVLWEHLGPRLYTPAEFMSQCDADPDAGSIVALRDCAGRDHAAWPTIDELRGRYIVTIHGTQTPAAPGAANERSWWQYASGDIRRRAAFPMFVIDGHSVRTVNGQPEGVPDAELPAFKAQQYNTDTDAFRAMWRRALDNTIFWDLEGLDHPDFTTDPPIFARFHGVVRPAAAHLLMREPSTCTSDCVEDNVGAIRQADAVARGLHIIMTDYPANFIGDFLYRIDPSAPVPAIPSRVDRPFFEAADVDASVARRFLPDAFREPGNRIYLDTSQRVIGKGGQPLYDALVSDVPDGSAFPPGASVTTDPKKGPVTALHRATPSRSVEPIADWEAFPSTSMTTHSHGPLELTPFGQGCLEAASSPSSTVGDHVRICRSPQLDPGRAVEIDLQIWNGLTQANAETTTLDHHIVQGAPMGDALRMRVDRSGPGTTVTFFTAAEANPDGTMRWIPHPHGPIHVASDLSEQGIAQEGDAVFLGTRVNGVALRLQDFAPEAVGYAYDLSYCGGAGCAPRTYGARDTVAMGGATYVRVHEARGSIYGGQDRSLYTTNRLEALTSGLPNVVQGKFLVRSDAPDATWLPLYRCVDWRRDMHVYWLATSPACANSGDDPGYPNGVLGYVSSAPGAGLAPLYHLRKGTENATGSPTLTPEHDTHDHYFAVGDADKASAPSDYTLFETLGYVALPPTAGALTVDATGLTRQMLAIAQVTKGYFDSSAAQVISLAPGTYSLVAQAQAASIGAFSVQSDGTVTYATSLDGVFAGRGTTTLRVVPHAVAIDGTALSRQQINVGYVTSLADSTSPIEVKLAAGPYSLGSQAEAAAIGVFRVTPSGTVDFASTLDGAFAGRGTTTLTVVPHAVSIDATGLSAQKIGVGYLTDDVDSRSPITLRLAAGPHSVHSQAQAGAIGVFRVTPAGTVDFAPALDGAFAGRGATTLTVVPHAVSVDGTGLSPQKIAVGYVTDYVDSTAPITLRLAAGPHAIDSLAQAAAIGVFRVAPSGAIDFAPELDGAFSGRGTSAVTIVAHPIAVDGTALPPGHLSIAAVTPFLPSGAPILLRLAAGPYGLFSDTRRVGTFRARTDGAVDYDPSFDVAFTGRGTATLRVVP